MTISLSFTLFHTILRQFIAFMFSLFTSYPCVWLCAEIVNNFLWKSLSPLSLWRETVRSGSLFLPLCVSHGKATHPLSLLRLSHAFDFWHHRPVAFHGATQSLFCWCSFSGLFWWNLHPNKCKCGSIVINLHWRLYQDSYCRLSSTLLERVKASFREKKKPVQLASV